MTNIDETRLREHRRCGCPEQYAGRDCPACRGTGLIPPVTREEYEALVAARPTAEEVAAALVQLEEGDPPACECPGCICARAVLRAAGEEESRG